MCETFTHRALAVTTAVALAHVCPDRLVDTVVTVLVAGATGGGRLSPDADNQRAALFVDGVVPDEVLGGGGPLGHRQLLHFWGMPVAAWVLLSPLAGSGLLRAALVGLVVGWLTHDASDAVFGLAGPGHGRGVPVFLWYGRVGGWFRADGVLERAFGGLVVVAGVWLAVGFVWPLPFMPGPVTIPVLVSVANVLAGVLP